MTAALNRRVAYGAAVLGAVVVAYEVVTLAAHVREISLPARVAVVPIVPRQPAAETVPRALDNVTEAHLFGVFRAEIETPLVQAARETAAPDTALDLKLTGILFRKDAQQREAIIASSEQERTYRVGQEIDGAAGAKVLEVLADRVVLEHEGTAEVLRFTRYVDSPSPAGGVALAAADGSGARPIAKPAQRARNDFLRLTRKAQDGRLIGFAALPGPNRGAFDGLGLHSNDVITGIDGVALRDRGGDSLLLERLAQGGSFTLTVLRSGAAQEIRVDANRLLGGG